MTLGREQDWRRDKARSPCYGSECYTAAVASRDVGDRDTVEVDAYVFDTRQSITDVPVYTVKRPWARRK